jgi:hypothetical protein
VGYQQVPVTIQQRFNRAEVVVAGGLGREEVATPGVPAGRGEGVADSAAVLAGDKDSGHDDWRWG